MTPEILLKTGIISKLRDGVKILAFGTLSKKLTVQRAQVQQGSGGRDHCEAAARSLRCESSNRPRRWQRLRGVGP